MKRALRFALFILALPTVAFATTVYTTGDFVSDPSYDSDATRADFTVSAGLAPTTLDTGTLHLTPSAHGVPGSTPQALFLLMPVPPADNFADTLPLGVAKIPGDLPEARELGLLGIGLIGLAAVVRWKLRGTSTRALNATEALPDKGQGTTRTPVGLEAAARTNSEVNDQVVPRAA